MVNYQMRIVKFPNFLLYTIILIWQYFQFINCNLYYPIILSDMQTYIPHLSSELLVVEVNYITNDRGNSKENQLCLGLKVFPVTRYHYKDINESDTVNMITFRTNNADHLFQTIEFNLNLANNQPSMYYGDHIGKRLNYNALQSDTMYVLIFQFMNEKTHELYHADINKDLRPCPASSDTNTALPIMPVCGTIVNCNTVIRNSGLRRRKRASETEEDNTTSSISRGALAAAIVVPILVLIIAAIGGFFLYRWLRARRSGHGVYKPKEAENNSNPLDLDNPALQQQPKEHLI